MQFNISGTTMQTVSIDLQAPHNNEVRDLSAGGIAGAVIGGLLRGRGVTLIRASFPAPGTPGEG